MRKRGRADDADGRGARAKAYGWSAGVLEVIEDWRGDTYRAVCTVRHVARVFVLHVFQKKSKSGIATPKPDLELIKERLKTAARRAKELEHAQTQRH